MSRTGCVAALVAAIGAGACSAAYADDPGMVAFGAGAYDFLHNYKTPEFRGEYRFGEGIYVFKPLAGVFVTPRASVFAYGGIRADLIFAEHYVIMPVAAVGYYDRGNGKDLGSPLEFKTGAEFAWRFDNASRLGIAFDHLSNAGIAKRNPGEENLLLMYSWPLDGAP
jgi:lipid A 3-O-deacylase